MALSLRDELKQRELFGMSDKRYALVASRAWAMGISRYLYCVHA